MNWVDFALIAVIAVFGIIGLMKGFIFSMFRLASFFISVIASIQFYPVISKILMETVLFTNIKTGILKNLLMQQTTQAPKVDAQAKQAAIDTIMTNMHLPGFFKEILIKQMPDVSKLVDVSQIMNAISDGLAKIAIDMISLVVLYILIRIGLVFIRFILQGIAKLPVFKQVDKLGGFAFGAVEGLLTIYIVFAVLILFHSVPNFKSFLDAVDNSVIAKFFYQNNFIVDWMFPKNKIV